FGFREPDHVRIRYPVRCRYDGFVAGPEDCLACVETGLLGAARYQDLRRLVVKRIVAGKFGLYRTLEVHCSVNGRVAGFAVVNRLLAGCADMVRRREIRLARTETYDIAASGTQLCGECNDSTGRRGLHPGHTF